MSDRREEVARTLADAVCRLDVVLNAWRFRFVADPIQGSHCGPFASGHYCRDNTRVGIACRDSIDNVYYEHAFIAQHRFCKEVERFAIGHDQLMRALGHSEDCQLIGTAEVPDAVVARDGGDHVSALIHDLRVFAAEVLSEPCAEFFDIVRRGVRVYSLVD